MKPDDVYDYTVSGFDNFLSRSVDNLVQVNLDSQGPTTTAMRFDSAQTSGMLGNKIQLGNVILDKNAIRLSDGEVPRAIIGTDVGGF